MIVAYAVNGVTAGLWHRTPASFSHTRQYGPEWRCDRCGCRHVSVSHRVHDGGMGMLQRRYSVGCLKIQKYPANKVVTGAFQGFYVVKISIPLFSSHYLLPFTFPSFFLCCKTNHNLRCCSCCHLQPLSPGQGNSFFFCLFSFRFLFLICFVRTKPRLFHLFILKFIPMCGAPGSPFVLLFV